MRVIPRRSKGRRQDENPVRIAPPQDPPGAAGTAETPSARDAGPQWPPSPGSRIAATGEPPSPAKPAAAEPASSAQAAGGASEATRPLQKARERDADPAEALGRQSLRNDTAPEPRTRELPTQGPQARGPETRGSQPPGADAHGPKAHGPETHGPETRGPEATTAVLPPVADSEAARRRARTAERQRRAAEVKRSRAARRQGLPYREPMPVARAADQHRSALLVMVLTLGLLIAAVAVTGGMIASSMRTQPVTLASPLHIYPVTQATAGPCPAGTQGVTGQSGTGPTCYRLSQGIAIRRVADLRVQESRVKPGGYDVAVTLRPTDRDAFADLTRATVGRDLAFIVQNRIVTLPRVDMAILDGKVVVTGSPDRASADRLVRDLQGR